MTDFDPERLLEQSVWLHRLARHLVGDPDLAADVVQDTFAAALASAPAADRTPGRLRAWLTRIARNRAHLHWRTERRRNQRETAHREAAVASTAPAAGDAAEQLAAQQRLLTAVQALPTAERDAVLLRYFEGLSPRVIAARLECTSAAVRSRLTRALASLRTKLAPDDDRRALVVALGPLLAGGSAARSFGLVGALLLAVAVSLGAWGLIAARTPNAPDASLAAPNAAGQVATHPAGAPQRDTSPAGTGATIAAVNAQREAAVSTSARAAVERPRAGQRRIIAIGRMLDEAGRPLSGARLVAADVESQPAAVAGADGRVEFEIAWPASLTSGNSSWLMLETECEGRVRLRRQERVGEGAEVRLALGDLILGPAGALRGEVVEADGSPARGARLRLVRAATPADGVTEEARRVFGRGLLPLGDYALRWATSDDNGRYMFDGVPVGAVSAVAFRRGRLHSYTPPVEITAFGVAAAPRLVLEPVPAANTIAGVVVGENGEALGEVEVSTFANRGPRNIDPEARTYAAPDTGAFVLPVLSGSELTVVAMARTPVERQLVQHDVAAGTAGMRLAFSVPKRVPIAVVVAGADGKPAPEPNVVLLDANGIGMRSRPEHGLNGDLVLVAPSEPFSLIVSVAGYRSQRLGPFDPEQLPDRIDVELVRTDIVTGRVTAHGQAIAGATVHAHRRDDRQPFHRFAHRVYSRLGEAMPTTVHTDARGCFTLPIHAAGSYVIHAEAEGHGRGESADLAVVAGVAAEPCTIELTQPSTITGLVRVPAGMAREGQVVAATRGDGHVDVVVTDGEGRFAFAGVSPGGWQVRWCRREEQEWLLIGRTWPAREVDAMPVDIVVAPGGTAQFDIDLGEQWSALVRGHLAFNGAACSGARVALACEGDYQRTVTTGDGAFALRGVPGPTTLHLFVQRPQGELELRRTLDLRTGERDVAIDIVTGAVEVRGLSMATANIDGGFAYALAWRAAHGGCDAVYRCNGDDRGIHMADGLPIGRAVLCRYDRRTDPATWPSLGEVDIVAGERRGLSAK
jgi:RNA polymerase sigma factor (sigma-70 family)